MYKSMDKAYYKSLNPTDRVLYADAVRKARKKEWDATNTDKVFQYRRATALKRCEQRVSVPTRHTIQKYNFTREELRPIFEALWEKWDLNGHDDDNSDTQSETL
jgi:hypothetical protein